MASARQSASLLISIGRIFFASAVLAFGVQYLLYGHLAIGLLPLPGWLSPTHELAYTMGAFLVLTGLALLAGWQVRAASLLLGAVLLAASCLHLTHFHSVLTDGGGRTGFLEPLSFAAAALFLHGLSGSGISSHIATFGRVVYGIAMVVFGAQHFMYVKFIEGLVPHWIGHQYFWVVFTGIVLVVTGLALVFNLAARAAGLILAAMFFGWLVTLHIPLCVAQPRSGDLWASLFVVVGLTGASLFFATSPSTSSTRRPGSR